MTERLYYTDSYLREFDATVIDRSSDGCRVYLDRTGFYPTSGGQLFDTGSLGGAPVTDVIDEGEVIAHVTASPVEGAIRGVIDWPRRFDHMQQHTGQHLLSAVFAELFGWATVSVHFGEESATLDVDTSSVSAPQLIEAERRANELVAENRPVTVCFAESGADPGLRKASEREGVLRVVAIEGLDRSACGGTHVRATGEIGPVQIRRIEKVRQATRLEFLCGMRAVRRARADFEALTEAARVFSATLDEIPALVRNQLDQLQASEKSRRKLEADLAGYRGRELYRSTTPDASGRRHLVERSAVGSLDDFRVLGQAFCAGPGAVFLAVLEQPPSMLLATSADSGINAGQVLKTAVTTAGGRGGGNASLAQGSVPSRDALEAALAAVLTAIS